MNKKQFCILLTSCIMSSLIGGFVMNWLLHGESNAYAQQGKTVWANSFMLTDADGNKLAELSIDKENEVSLILKDKQSRAALQLKPNALWMWNKEGKLRVSLLVQPDGSKTRGEGTLFCLITMNKDERIEVEIVT
jgi:hypothetical protein